METRPAEVLVEETDNVAKLGHQDGVGGIYMDKNLSIVNEGREIILKTRRHFTLHFVFSGEIEKKE